MTMTQAKILIEMKMKELLGFSPEIFFVGEGLKPPSPLEAREEHRRFPIHEAFEIDLQLRFSDTFVDILAFPHPKILLPEYAENTTFFVNFINTHTFYRGGRFFVDPDTLDIAYSYRISYDYLSALSNEAVDEGLLTPIAFFADASVPLYEVATTGSMSAEEGIAYLKKIWSLDEEGNLE